MILILSKYFNLKNGAARSALDMARASLKNENTTALIYGQTFDFFNLYNWLKKKNLSIHRAPQFRGKNPNLLSRCESVLFDRSRLKTLQNMNPEILLVNSLGSDFFGKHLKQELDCQTVLVVRESPSFYKNKTSAIKRIIQFDYHLFVSKNGMEDWMNIAGLIPENCYHVPNCLDEKIAQPVLKSDKNEIRVKLGLSKKDFILVCIGRFMDRKNQQFLVEQLTELKNQIQNIKLVFIGKRGGQYSQIFNQYIHEKKLQNHVVCTGRIKNVLEFIYASDCLVLPSKAEASPRVIYEAMSVGVPTIASNVDGVSELIEHEKTGWLFDLKSSKEYRQGVIKMSSDEQYRNELGSAARLNFLENYTFEKYKFRMGKFFNSIKN